MKKKVQFLNMLIVAAVALGLLLVSARMVFAKGSFDKIVVSGGGLENEIDVTDPSLLEFFSFSDFPNSKVQEPSIGVDEGYTIVRYGQWEDGTYEAWDMLHYYLPSGNSGGYVYYDGLINGSEYDGKWYASSPEGDAALLNLLTTNQTAPQTDNSFVLIVVVVAVALIGTVGYLVRQRLILVQPH